MPKGKEGVLPAETFFVEPRVLTTSRNYARCEIRPVLINQNCKMHDTTNLKKKLAKLKCEILGFAVREIENAETRYLRWEAQRVENVLESRQRNQRKNRKAFKKANGY